MISPQPSFPKRITPSPPFIFILFLVSNIFLAYTSVGLEIKIWIGIAGILSILTLLILSNAKSPSGEEDSLTLDYLDGPPAWAWLLIWGAAIFFRFFKLTSLPVWPMWDDAATSYYSIKLSQHWNWDLFYGPEKWGCLSIWLRGFYYKFFIPSLFSLWFLQALESCATLLIGYWACRQFFSRSTAFVLLSLFGLGFWTLYLGQFCAMEYLSLFWEFLGLGLLGKMTKEGASSISLSFLLGLSLGLGVYIWVNTIPATIVLAVGFIWVCLHPRPVRVKSLAAFAAPLFLLSIPASFVLWNDLGGGHLQNYLLFQNPKPAGEQFSTSFSYLTVFLWGTLDKSYFNFGPLFGGYLNPLLGSAFLLGLAGLFRFKSRPLFGWVAGAFLLCLLPGILSNTLEMMRVLTLLPFIFALTAYGLQILLASFPAVKRLPLFWMILVCSTALDLYQLYGPYHQWALPDKVSAGSKSPEHYQAFRVLSRWDQLEGPGLVMDDFYYDNFDQSLYVTAYVFNAASNPRLSPSQARWAAVLLAPWDREVFKRRFPSALFYDLSAELVPAPLNGGWMAVVPLEGPAGPILRGWVGIHNQLQALFPDYPFHVKSPSYARVLDHLWEIWDRSPDESFLKNCLMEKMVDASFRSSDLRGAERLSLLPPEKLWHPPFFNLRYAILFHRLGLMNFKEGREKEARKLFLRAAQFDPDYPLQRALSLLKK